MVQTFVENSSVVPQEVEHRTYDPETPLLHRYPTELKTGVQTNLVQECS